MPVERKKHPKITVPSFADHLPLQKKKTTEKSVHQNLPNLNNKQKRPPSPMIWAKIGNKS